MAQQLRLVIADDESLIRMNLKETLVGLGYLVVGEAGDGVSVVNLARELRPDLVIMDIKMPKLDGIQAAKVLTEDKIAPVLLLTAYSDRELVDRAREAGVVNYIVKPFRDAELLPAIEIAMARYAEFQEMDKKIGDLTEVLETRKLVERAKGVLMDTQGLKEQLRKPGRSAVRAASLNCAGSAYNTLPRRHIRPRSRRRRAEF